MSKEKEHLEDGDELNRDKKKKDKKKKKKDKDKKGKKKKKDKDKKKKKDKDKKKKKKDKLEQPPEVTTEATVEKDEDEPRVKPKVYTLEDLAARTETGIEFDTQEIKDFVHTVRRMARKMAVGSKIRIPNFGDVEKYISTRKIGRNPKTGEEIKLEPKERIRFKMSVNLRNP